LAGKIERYQRKVPRHPYWPRRKKSVLRIIRLSRPPARRPAFANSIRDQALKNVQQIAAMVLLRQMRQYPGNGGVDENRHNK